MQSNIIPCDPVYVSKPSARNLWSEYRIYRDRMELDSRILFKTFVIFYKDIISIKIYDPPVINTRFWTLKLDLADFKRHVGVERKDGFMKHIRFTPCDPCRFVQEVNRFMIV